MVTASPMENGLQKKKKMKPKYTEAILHQNQMQPVAAVVVD